MKLLIGLVVSCLVGVFCRYFDIPVGSPPVIPGAFLVLAMTIGYSGTDALMAKRQPATTKALCGGPTGQIARVRRPDEQGSIKPSQPAIHEQE